MGVEQRDRNEPFPFLIKEDRELAPRLGRPDVEELNDRNANFSICGQVLNHRLGVAKTQVKSVGHRAANRLPRLNEFDLENPGRRERRTDPKTPTGSVQNRDRVADAFAVEPSIETKVPPTPSLQNHSNLLHAQGAYGVGSGFGRKHHTGESTANRYVDDKSHPGTQSMAPLPR